MLRFWTSSAWLMFSTPWDWAIINATERGFPLPIPVWSLIGDRPPSSRDGELLITNWIAETVISLCVSGTLMSVQSVSINLNTSLHTASTVPLDHETYAVGKRERAPNVDARISITLLQKWWPWTENHWTKSKIVVKYSVRTAAAVAASAFCIGLM